MTARTLVSGGTGFVGRFVVEGLLAAGHDVTIMGPNAPTARFFAAPVRFVEGALDPDRDQRPAFAGIDNFVHAAFDHLPGKYRGGEGDDAASFRLRNLDGTLALFEAARMQGVSRVVFLSSRAVYGAQKPGLELTEETEPHPDTLYGEVKLAAEQRLAGLSSADFAGTSLRATGVYGPPAKGRDHKWTELLRDYLAGTVITSRAGTEVHGADVAAAVRLVLDAPPERVQAQALNLSDIVVDRHDLLEVVKDVTGSPHPLPARADTAALNAMATTRLRALGWKPGGWPLFEATVEALAKEMLRQPPPKS